MKLLDTAFKAGQMMARGALDLKIKTSIDRAGLQALGADVQRVSRLLKATGADANTVAAGFRASQATLASFQAMSSAQKTAYRKANNLGGSNEAAEKRIANQPYAQLEEQARNQRQERADHARENAEMARDRAEALAPVKASGNYIEQKGLNAISFGLGGSVEGFLLGSAQHFMAMDSILTTLGRRFRETGRSAGYFGQTLGYTIQQTSAMVERLGGSTDRVTRGQFQRYAGFGRNYGLDPNENMSVLGALQQIAGQEIGDATLMSLAGRAQTRGMGQGRMGEYLQGLQSFAASGLSATGRTDLNMYAGLYDIPGMVFGAQDPRGQGAMGAQFMQGLQGTLTGSGPMQSFLLRAMGFGRQGGPDYITAKKRLEAGVYDAQNLQDIFGEFRARNMGKGAQFRALESVAGGQLKAWQIEKLVDAFGTSAEGFNQLKGLGSSEEKQRFVEAALAGTGDQSTYESEGFAGLGRSKGRIGMGEYNAVEIESMQMSVGQDIAEAMIDMRHVIANIAAAFEKALGMDPGKILTDLTEILRDASEELKNITPQGLVKEIAGAVRDGVVQALAPGAAHRPAGGGAGEHEGGSGP